MFRLLVPFSYALASPSFLALEVRRVDGGVNGRGWAAVVSGGSLIVFLAVTGTPQIDCSSSLENKRRAFGSEKT